MGLLGVCKALVTSPKIGVQPISSDLYVIIRYEYCLSVCKFVDLIIRVCLADDVQEAYNLIKDLEPTTPQEYILKGVVNAALGQEQGSVCITLKLISGQIYPHCQTVAQDKTDLQHSLLEYSCGVCCGFVFLTHTMKILYMIKPLLTLYALGKHTVQY